MKEERPTRLAIVNYDLCKPKDCSFECKKACPVNRIGKPCIEIKPQCNIDEKLCIGCSACAKKCPFGAITIVSLPTSLEKDIVHRYGKNLFKLHRLPVLKKGIITGLVGTNGIGKSTALKILAGIEKPNLGKEVDPGWQSLINYFKGSELHSYFIKLLEEEMKVTVKAQYVDKLPEMLAKKYKNEELKVNEIKEIQEGKDKEIISLLEINQLMEKEVKNLSGGELQRLYICISCLQKSNVYMFDEPTSYLDVKQRINAAKAIRSLSDELVLVVEHDLAILDLMSDIGCVIYGKPGAYGVITKPFSIKNAINIFLDGYIPTENMKFRDAPLKFNKSSMDMEFSVGEVSSYSRLNYEEMEVELKDFKLKINKSEFGTSEIILFLGENGMGKTTFVNVLAGLIKTDKPLPSLNISLKPQKILPKFTGTVREAFLKKIKSSFSNPLFYTDVIKPLNIEYLFDQSVQKLSGGELQRVALVLCLGKPANIYLLDEPSAYLDADQRIMISKIIKRFIYQSKSTCFVVEHDLIVATYLADKVVVFEGQPSKSSEASKIISVEEGMNRFLKNLNITFRREQNTMRPRVNKPESQKDREQKESGKYFF